LRRRETHLGRVVLFLPPKGHLGGKGRPMAVKVLELVECGGGVPKRRKRGRLAILRVLVLRGGNHLKHSFVDCIEALKDAEKG